MRVPEDAYETAKAHKEQLGVTWGEYLTLPTEDGEVYGTGVNPEIVEQIVDKMEDSKGVSIENVTIDDSGTTMDRTDVENIVENWVSNNYERLRRGQL